MATPSTVTRRAQGNDFVGTTGMMITGVTGFGLSTGFYITNSGSRNISTEISVDETQLPGVLGFPSGKRFDVLAGQSRFIPFEFAFLNDNYGAGPDTTSTGPEGHGRWVTDFQLNSRSLETLESDASGAIALSITGQVTGFGADASSSGPYTSSTPAYPSGFLVRTDLAIQGRPKCVLRWEHPSTGYYLTQYKIEYAGNITDSATATGSWTGLADFDINRSYHTFPKTYAVTSDFDYYKYATNSGISQLHTRGTPQNPASPCGEYTVNGLGFGADYYFRIKSRFTLGVAGGSTVESPYIYGYPVDNFNVEITNNDINGGLLSGSTTLGALTDPSTVIANTTPPPNALKVYFEDEQKNVNLKTSFDDKLTNITGSVNFFDPSHADYGFSGVHFIVDQHNTVGSTSASNAGIDTGARLVYGSTEIKSNLIFRRNSSVLGMGGLGGNGGYTTIEMDEKGAAEISAGKLAIKGRTTVDSGDGGAGSPAIYISDANISELRIKKNPLAKIYGGGGGGGGGDPFFYPKAFTLNTRFFENLDKLIARIDAFLSGVPYNEAANTEKATKLNIQLDPKEPGIISIDKVNYKLSDIVGTQHGGSGGGGQGFAKSLGGYSKIFEDNNQTNYLGIALGGGRKYAGIGQVSNPTTNTSAGGTGGAYGADGETPKDVNAALLYNLTAADGQPLPASGGTGGEAIKIIDTNSNYSTFDSLVQPEGASSISSTEFPNLVAWFTTDDTSATYFDTTTVTSYKQINKWKAKNDTDIYIQFYNGTNGNYRPMLIENGTTTNYGAYTDPFNNQDVVFFGNNNNNQPGGGVIKNIVTSGKIENSMSGFEIVYFLYPGTVIDSSGGKALKADSYNWFYLNAGTGYEIGDMRAENPRRGANGPIGFTMHQWTNSFIKAEIGTNYVGNPTNFYKPSTAISAFRMSDERAGLNNQSVPFNQQEMVYGETMYPTSAWMYSISSFKKGGSMYYAVYNNLNKRKTRVFENFSDYAFPLEPKVGYSNTAFDGTDQSYNGYFYGCISDIVVFKSALDNIQREALFASLAQKKLKIKSSANRDNANNQNVLADNTGYAGFNIGPSW